MRLITLISALALTLADATERYTTIRQDEPQALAAVQRLLTGWREADTVAVSSVLHSDFRLVTFREMGTPREEVQLDTRERLMQSSARLSAGQWDVRLLGPQARVSDEGVTTVWAAYEFYIRGNLSHCGIESYQLYRLRSGWKIINFADTHHPCTH